MKATYRQPSPAVQSLTEVALLAQVKAINDDEMSNPRQTYVVEDWSDPFDFDKQRYVTGVRELKRGEFFVEAAWNTKAQQTQVRPGLYLATADGYAMPADMETRPWQECDYAGAVRCTTIAVRVDDGSELLTRDGLIAVAALEERALEWRDEALLALPDEVPDEGPEDAEEAPE